MNVLMLSGEYPPHGGGAGIQARKLARALLGQGCRVGFLTPQRDSDQPLREEDEGIVVHRFPVERLTKTLGKWRGLGVLDRMLSTRRAVREHAHAFDLIHAHMASDVVAYAVAPALKAGKPILCKLSCSAEHFDLETLHRVPFIGARLRGMLDGMTAWIATSEAVRKSALEHGIPEHRIHSIANGVEIDPKPRTARLSRKFLYLGRLSSTGYRDVPTLLKAFDRLAGTDNSAELALVGGGDLLSQTRHSVGRLRYFKRVQVAGFEPSRKWLHWADSLVLPSRVEGLSNALLEGMAAGLACVANDIGPNRQALAHGDAGILVPPGDEDALYKALCRLNTAHGEAQRLGKAALERARKEYRIESVAEKHLALYEETLNLESAVGAWTETEDAEDSST